MTNDIPESAQPKRPLEAPEHPDAGEALRGKVEPHAALLEAPSPAQSLYKVMRTEHLLASIEGSYMYFNRVDCYRDFPNADLRDGEQLPNDRLQNKEQHFQAARDFSVADYYDQCRGRTYSCCFSLENSNHIWEEYGNGGSAGKVCVIFDFGRLRETLNASIAAHDAAITYEGIRCVQIFSINYGIVKYVDWNTYRANRKRVPNPITYTYLKDKRFDQETELRVSLSAIGLGDFALADGTGMEFPPGLHFGFDYRTAIQSGAIKEILHSPDCDKDRLHSDLSRLRITPQN